VNRPLRGKSLATRDPRGNSASIHQTTPNSKHPSSPRVENRGTGLPQMLQTDQVKLGDPFDNPLKYVWACDEPCHLLEGAILHNCVPFSCTDRRAHRRYSSHTEIRMTDNIGTRCFILLQCEHFFFPALPPPCFGRKPSNLPCFAFIEKSIEYRIAYLEFVSGHPGSDI
jgi:hypothetical protein